MRDYATYNKSAAGRARNARYRKTQKCKAAWKRYNHSAKGRANQARFRKTSKRKVSEAKYEKTAKAAARHKQYALKPGTRMVRTFWRQGKIGILLKFLKCEKPR